MLKFFRLTAFVVFTAFAFVSLAATTAHAQKPALTKSIDEPGRSPYFSSVTQFCADSGLCPISSFKPVPAGFRLVVTHVSVDYVPNTFIGHSDNLIYLQESLVFSSPHVYLPAPSSVGTRLVTSAPITFYVEPGSTPVITALNASSLNFISGSIVGYLVAID
jgi:hypothetical protein